MDTMNKELGTKGHYQQWVPSIEGKKGCHQETRAQLDKCSDGETQNIVAMPPVCISGGPGERDCFKGRRSQGNIRCVLVLMDERVSVRHRGVKGDYPHKGSSMDSGMQKWVWILWETPGSSVWLDPELEGGGDRWDCKGGRYREDVRSRGNLYASPSGCTSLFGTQCKKVRNSGNVCGQSRSFGCLIETSLLTPVLWSMQLSMVEPDFLD